VALLLAALPIGALAAPNSWSLSSQDGKCVIEASLDPEGALRYQVKREGRSVILRSPLGLRRDDEAFDRGLTLESAGKAESRREIYELFAGGEPPRMHVAPRVAADLAQFAYRRLQRSLIPLPGGHWRQFVLIFNLSARGHLVRFGLEPSPKADKMSARR
jgi:hypothetical protein